MLGKKSLSKEISQNHGFYENIRVKIPVILHLCRLGHDYISLTNTKRDKSKNVFIDLFSESIKRINQDGSVANLL